MRHSKHNILCGAAHEYLEKKNNLYHGHQYEMQKSGEGGGNNVYKIFTSRVEEGYIPNTISYVELFMNTLKIKK